MERLARSGTTTCDTEWKPVNRHRPASKPRDVCLTERFTTFASRSRLVYVETDHSSRHLWQTDWLTLQWRRANTNHRRMSMRSTVLRTLYTPQRLVSCLFHPLSLACQPENQLQNFVSRSHLRRSFSRGYSASESSRDNSFHCVLKSDLPIQCSHRDVRWIKLA